SAAAKSALSKFANNVLNQHRDMDVSIYGYTDNQGWKNSTAESLRKQKPLVILFFLYFILSGSE
ncbi:hypothetical protein, partial [Dialister invisus]|uniref:hypothetical protein n=1 Tax=Dialister invisus TaxID=218538 RepID=UPI003AB47CF9